MEAADEFFERLVGDTNVESYRIVKLSEKSLTLANEENNATFLWNRDKKE